MSEPGHLNIFARAHHDGTLSLRLCVFVHVDDWAANIRNAKRFPISDDWLRIAGFKGFMDGSLGSRTAYMRAPYNDNPPDDPERRGLLMPLASKDGELQRQCRAVAAAGLRMAVHAIGDEANHMLLDAYAELGHERRDLRPRVEHAQHLLPSDVPRFAKLGVVASMQPLHKADDGRYAEQALGRERCETSYAFRSLLESGAHVAFGSDWPVVTCNPFPGIAAAVTGRTLDGVPWMTHQNISVEQALAAYTAGSAFAAKMEDRLGRIRRGYLADFVILEADPLSVPPETLGDIRVAETFVGGKPVFDAGEHAVQPSRRRPRDTSSATLNSDG
jgi:predicted amidohydrolase YtcJ